MAKMVNFVAHTLPQFKSKQQQQQNMFLPGFQEEKGREDEIKRQGCQSSSGTVPAGAPEPHSPAAPPETRGPGYPSGWGASLGKLPSDPSTLALHQSPKAQGKWQNLVHEQAEHRGRNKSRGEREAAAWVSRFFPLSTPEETEAQPNCSGSHLSVRLP